MSMQLLTNLPKGKKNNVGSSDLNTAFLCDCSFHQCCINRMAPEVTQILCLFISYS
jgi:hypothetical protein